MSLVERSYSETFAPVYLFGTLTEGVEIMPVKDMTGQKFGRLTVIEYAYYDKEKTKAMWKCSCECGKEKIVSGNDLRRGHAKSCGCFNSDCRKTHGLSGTKLYNAWTHMVHRCYDSKDINFKNYGGRGIKVCDEWQDYKPFYDWALANGYQEQLSLDRINVNGNYEPTNCSWVTMAEQRNNKQDTVRIFHFGKWTTLKDLAQSTGISRYTLYFRFKKGDRDEKLIRPVRGNQTAN